MKYLFFILVLSFFFISQDIAYSQKKAKKIETWEVYGNVDYWYFCRNENGDFDDGCVEKVKIKFSNTSTNHISKITFKLKINVANSTIYKKQHTINVDIDPDETVPYDIKLSGKVTGYIGYSYKDFVDDIEIISVK